MKASILLLTCLLGSVFAGQPKGIDVSSHQPNVNWGSVKANGVQFAYIKATEGTGYKSPQFNSQYVGATKKNLIRGAYHFALPVNMSFDDKLNKIHIS